jgi:hypothetical protein
MSMRARHVALYARVSGEQQAQAGTIASQVASLRERIGADGARLEPETQSVGHHPSFPASWFPPSSDGLAIW